VLCDRRPYSFEISRLYKQIGSQDTQDAATGSHGSNMQK